MNDLSNDFGHSLGGMWLSPAPQIATDLFKPTIVGTVFTESPRPFFKRKRKLLPFLLLFALLLTLTLRPTQAQEPAVIAPELAAEVADDGAVRVIVGLNMGRSFTPEGELSADQVAQQRQAIAAAQEILQGQLSADARTLREFETVPYMAVRVGSADLNTLARSPFVLSLHKDELAAPTMLTGSHLIGAPSAWAAGYTGAGQTVVVIDSGVDAPHPFFGGRVVTEACFSTTDATQGSTSLCPNGTNQQTGSGASSPTVPKCYFNGANICDHGTHVAGTVAGSNSDFNGVAPGANIIGIQVFSHFPPSVCGGDTPCVLSYGSDQMAALDYVYSTLRTQHTLASINMSLGGGGPIQTACDDNPLKSLIDNLLTKQIATVIAAGNNGFTNGVSSPACISTAITVGATDDCDFVADFSNSGALVDMLAPGVDIDSAAAGSGYNNKQGTSMATPHVAGAWAVMRQKFPTASVNTILAMLQQSAFDVFDQRGGGIHTKPRLRLGLATGTQEHYQMFPSFIERENGDMAIGSDGSYHAVYNSQYDYLYYAYCAGECDDRANWQSTYIPSTNLGSTRAAQIEVDAQNRPRIAFNEGVGSAYYAQCDTNCLLPTSWNTLQVFSENIDPYVRNRNTRWFALDQLGRPRMIVASSTYNFPGPYPNYAKYLFCDANCTTLANWQTTTIMTIMLDTRFDSVYHSESLIFTSSGQPRVAYVVYDQLYYLACDTNCGTAANWHSVALGAQDGGYFEENDALDVAVDRQNRVRMVRREESGLKYMTCNADCTTAANWQTAAVAGLLPEAGKGVKLLFDGQNRARLAYFTDYPSPSQLEQMTCTANCDSATAATWHREIIEEARAVPNCGNYFSQSMDGPITLLLDSADHTVLAYGVREAFVNNAYPRISLFVPGATTVPTATTLRAFAVVDGMMWLPLFALLLGSVTVGLFGKRRLAFLALPLLLIACQPPDSAVEAPDVNGLDAARQLIEALAPSAPDGWTVAPCEGSAPILCITTDDGAYGYAEMLVMPIETLGAESPIHVGDSADVLEALMSDHLESVTADRLAVNSADVITPLPYVAARMGNLPALTSGFTRSDASDVVQERYLYVIAYDTRNLYWFTTSYDPASISTFDSDATLSAFAPYFQMMPASLPLGKK